MREISKWCGYVREWISVGRAPHEQYYSETFKTFKTWSRELIIIIATFKIHSIVAIKPRP